MERPCSQKLENLKKDRVKYLSKTNKTLLKEKNKKDRELIKYKSS